jgi:hypothetical protein
MIILDTDHISALQYRDASKAFALQARLETLSPDEIATTAITIEEQTRGWLLFQSDRPALLSSGNEYYTSVQQDVAR